MTTFIIIAFLYSNAVCCVGRGEIQIEIKKVDLPAADTESGV